MKISIYRQANYLPLTKQDKNDLSKLCSYPNLPETVVVENEDHLIELVTSFAWSPSIFSGKRHNDNFISADFIGIDIDNGLSILESERRVAKLGLCALCLPSPSFNQENQKHRLIFPLAKTITNKKIFDDTWDYLMSLFPELDEQCSDYARFYCMSKMDDGFFQLGDFLLPVENKTEEEKIREYAISDVQITVTDDIRETVKQLYGKDKETIPESVEFFIRNAPTGLEGMWINSLNSCVFSLSLSGVDEDKIWQLCEQLAPNELDSKDVYQIKRSIRDGENKRKEII